MLRMVGPIVAGAGVGEDRQAGPMKRNPLGEFSELLGLNGQLATSARMRSHRIPVKTSDGNAEPLVCSFGQAMRPIDLVGIEIDVRVKVEDLLGHAGALSRVARSALSWGSLGKSGGYKRAFPASTGRLLGRRQVVRHRFLVPAFAGSNPAAPANLPIAQSLPRKVRGPMSPRMAAALLRLVMLVAVALMPFSMARASIAVAPLAAEASGGHCNDRQEPADVPSSPKPHCAVCAALPAGEAPPVNAELRPVLLRVVEAARWIAEREPDIDTPPPKVG